MDSWYNEQEISKWLDKKRFWLYGREDANRFFTEHFNKAFNKGHESGARKYQAEVERLQSALRRVEAALKEGE